MVGVPDERWGEVGRALVVPRAGAEVSPDDIMNSLSGRLAKYKLPKSVVLVDALPRNATGKILKARLRSQYGSAPARGAEEACGRGTRKRRVTADPLRPHGRERGAEAVRRRASCRRGNLDSASPGTGALLIDAEWPQ